MNKYLCIVIIILFAVFWILWMPGQRAANDYHINLKQAQVSGLYPWIWKEVNAADGLGEYTISTFWSQPLLTLYGLFGFLNISFPIQTRILIILSILLGSFSANLLFNYLKISGPGKYIGIFFYLCNTFFLLLIDGGQISLALAYATVPLNLYLYFRSIDQPNLRSRVYFALSLVLISFFDIRFIFLLFLLFLTNLLYILIFLKSMKIQLFKNIIATGFLVGVILIGMHAFWLLPAFFSRNPQLPQTYERAGQIDFLSFSSLLHSIFLQQPHWYKNVFGQISDPKLEFFIIPLLTFLAPILRRKDKIVGFWLIITVLSIFLSKGSKEPLGIVYVWLFTHIPGFSLFRDPVKFYTLLALSYSILISITVSNLTKLVKFTPILVLIYLILIARPIFLGQMTGMFSFPRYEQEYLDQGKILERDKSFSRIFWIPTHQPLGYTNVNHPWVGAARVSKQRPFAAGTKGTYETFNFLREAPYMGQIFDVAGIGYISYPPLDQKRDDMHPDNIRYFYNFNKQLANLPWLSQMDSPIPLYKVKEHQDKFFITSNIWWVVGSDNIYNEATKSAKLKLSKNSLIFAEEYPGLGQRLDELPEVKIVLNNKTILDLAASFINISNLIFPAKKLDFAPDKVSGWWKREAADLVNWRAFLQTKYEIDNQDFDLGGGWAVGEGNRKLKINNGQLKKGNILLARVLESTRSGSLSFSQDGKLIGQVDTKKTGNNIRWFEVGELKGGGELEIKSFGDINVVNALAVLDKNKWINYQDKANNLQGKVIDFNEKNAQDATPAVTYREINPTKYVVNISGLTKASFLVFSQNYDGLWKLDGQTPLPVYSLLNGFKMEKDGEYVVEFTAQKYVNYGLIISGLTAGVLILLLIKYSKHS